MTRIISGTARGRTVKVPASGTRPTSDRVRESIFNALSHRLGNWHELRVLDLYAGSGALALEALSRGAAAATAVEKAASASAVIKQNAATLGLNLTVVTASVENFVAKPATSAFDVVFLDPPYELDSATLTGVLEKLVSNGHIGPDAVVVIERSARSEHIQPPEPLTEADLRAHGETSVQTLIW